MKLLLFCCCLLVSAQESRVLLLKNGKKIVCTAYEVAGQRVTITREGQTFSLPESAIDWERSRLEEDKQAELAKQEPVVKEKPNREKSLGEYYQDNKKHGVALTTDSLKGRGYRNVARPVTLNYAKFGNNIIVAATINGKGPFNFILDTGASLTVVSPAVGKQLKLDTHGQISLSGVEGRSVQASTATLDVISLGAASVRQLKVALRNIPVLNQNRVVGLLGQDFLNHFVMRLDSQAETLTLTPHGSTADATTAARPVSKGEFSDKDREVLETADGVFNRVGDITKEYGNLTRQYGTGQDGKSRLKAQRSLHNLSADLNRLHAQIRKIHSAMKRAEGQPMDELTAKRLEAIGRCADLLNRGLNELKRYGKVLQRAYASGEDGELVSRNRAAIHQQWKKLNSSLNLYLECIK